MLFGLTLPAWLLSLLANKWVRYALLFLGGFLLYEIWKARQQAIGAKTERDKFRAAGAATVKKMQAAPQRNEEGTADALDNGRY